MPAYKLPNGRWRAQVFDKTAGKNVSAASVLELPPTSYKSERAAWRACLAAEKVLSARISDVTVSEFRDRWTTEPLFIAGRKESTIHNRRDRTRAFAAEFGHLPMCQVDDRIVASWVASRSRHTADGLSVMWNAAMSRAAGQIVDRNVWANLGLPRSKGRALAEVPSEQMIDLLARKARELCSPHYEAWLRVGAHTGMRSGELDALRWENVDLNTGRISVREQWSSKVKKFTTPKNGLAREALITPNARTALLNIPGKRTGFVFLSLRDSHLTASTRTYHWKAVKAATGFTGSQYLATRHYAGWYMTNILLLPSEDVAIALGHTDHGEQVRRVYGHRDQHAALDRVQASYESASNVTQLPTDFTREARKRHG